MSARPLRREHDPGAVFDIQVRPLLDAVLSYPARR
jgi:hypothetical protein